MKKIIPFLIFLFCVTLAFAQGNPTYINTSTGLMLNPPTIHTGRVTVQVDPSSPFWSTIGGGGSAVDITNICAVVSTNMTTPGIFAKSGTVMLNSDIGQLNDNSNALFLNFPGGSTREIYDSSNVLAFAAATGVGALRGLYDEAGKGRFFVNQSQSYWADEVENPIVQFGPGGPGAGVLQMTPSISNLDIYPPTTHWGIVSNMGVVLVPDGTDTNHAINLGQLTNALTGVVRDGQDSVFFTNISSITATSISNFVINQYNTNLFGENIYGTNFFRNGIPLVDTNELAQTSNALVSAMQSLVNSATNQVFVEGTNYVQAQGFLKSAAQTNAVQLWAADQFFTGKTVLGSGSLGTGLVVPWTISSYAMDTNSIINRSYAKNLGAASNTIIHAFVVTNKSLDSFATIYVGGDNALVGGIQIGEGNVNGMGVLIYNSGGGFRMLDQGRNQKFTIDASGNMFFGKNVQTVGGNPQLSFTGTGATGVTTNYGKMVVTSNFSSGGPTSLGAGGSVFSNMVSTPFVMSSETIPADSSTNWTVAVSGLKLSDSSIVRFSATNWTPGVIVNCQSSNGVAVINVYNPNVLNSKTVLGGTVRVDSTIY